MLPIAAIMLMVELYPEVSIEDVAAQFAFIFEMWALTVDAPSACGGVASGCDEVDKAGAATWFLAAMKSDRNALTTSICA
jgi:hypothetical protein